MQGRWRWTLAPGSSAVCVNGLHVHMRAAHHATPPDRVHACMRACLSCRVLRYIAHAHGAFLCYLSGLHGASEGSGAEDAALLDNFTRLMNHLIFTGLEKKP